MLVGLHGPKYSGKDTVFQLLRELQPEKNWERLAFGDTLKDVACLTLGISRETLETLKMMEETAQVTVSHHTEMGWRFNSSISVRQYLQNLGTEAGRQVLGRDIWINATLPYSDSSFHQDRHIAITDVRFYNEARKIFKLEGTVWAVNYDHYDTESAEHTSENPLPSILIDEYISNQVRDDSFTSLRDQIKALLVKENI